MMIDNRHIEDIGQTREQGFMEISGYRKLHITGMQEQGARMLMKFNFRVISIPGFMNIGLKETVLPLYKN